MHADTFLTRREMVAAALFFSGSLRAAESPQFFSPEDFATLQAFTEILIPTDETPGAREAKCAHFIDFVLQSSDETRQTEWRKAIETLKDAGFHAASPERRLQIVIEMDQAGSPAYRLIKQQNAFAFYTSREGTIQTLDYKGNTYNVTFPACTHPEHQEV
jgi:hypothetical protein